MDGSGGWTSIRRFPDPGTLRPGRARPAAVWPARGAHVAVSARARRGAHPRHGRRARGSDQPRAGARCPRHRIRRSDAARASRAALGDDPVLREDLSNWFSLLGEPALAASTLEPLAASQSGPDAGACWPASARCCAAPVKRAALARRSSARSARPRRPDRRRATRRAGRVGGRRAAARGGGRLLPGGVAAPRTARRSRDGGGGAVPRVRDPRRSRRKPPSGSRRRSPRPVARAPPTRCAASTRAGSAPRRGPCTCGGCAERSARATGCARSARPSTRGSTPSST